MAIDANPSSGGVELVEYRPWWPRDLDTFATVDLPVWDGELRSREIVTAWRPGAAQVQVEPSGPVFDAIARLMHEADDDARPLLEQLRSHLVQDIRNSASVALNLATAPEHHGRGWYVPAVTIPEPPITLDDETLAAGVASLLAGHDAPHERPGQLAYLQRATGTPLDAPAVRLDQLGQLLLSDGEQLRTFVPARGTLDTITTAHLVRSPRGGGELLLHGMRDGQPAWQLAAHRGYLAWGYQGGSVTELAALICTLRDQGPRADTSRLNYQHPDITTIRDRLAQLDPDQDHEVEWPW